LFIINEKTKKTLDGRGKLGEKAKGRVQFTAPNQKANAFAKLFVQSSLQNSLNEL